MALSVRALVESIYRSEDLFASGGSPARAQTGMLHHKNMQADRGEGYASEVALRYEYEDENIVLELSGRIDGLVETRDGFCIEEVKTTYISPLRVGEGQQVHWAQARCYAAIFAQQKGLSSVTVRLVYVTLPDEQRVTLEEVRRADELLEWMEKICAEYCAGLSLREQRVATARLSVSGMKFPYPTLRPGQRALMCAVFDTIEQKGYLMANAPTGIGKTIAALYPALKAWSRELCDKIFYLTARNTIRGVAAETLRGIIEDGVLLRGVILSAKEKVCLNSLPLACDPDTCPFAKGFYTRLDRSLEELPLQGCMDEEFIAQLARRHTLCPHELSLCIAQESDVVICDYNYAFDPRARIRRFFDEGGAYTLLIDEAHNLVDRARDMFSACIIEKTYADLKKMLPAKEGTPAQRSLRRAITALQKWFRALRRDMAENEVAAQCYAELDEEMVQDCLSVLQCLEEMRTAGSAGEYGALFDEAYFPLRNFLDLYAGMDATYGLYGETAARRLELHMQCLDPDEPLHRAYGSVESVVFFSASMTPFSYYQRLLGTRDMAETLDIASAFPQHNLGIYTLGLDTTYRGRDRSLEQLADALCAFARVHRGNYLFYFPSYAYMRKACEAFSQRSPAAVLLQHPGMDEAQRAAFLQEFEQEREESLAAFAVMGGIFGEGIDLVGDRLIGVAVVGVGLPQICLPRDMMRQYHDDLTEDGFSYAYVVPGFNRVLQAVGRLIRTPQDKGAALLIDKRFERRDYTRLYPPHWSHIQRLHTGQLSAKLEDFWHNGAGKPGR